jgi:hypothetical protein
MGNRLIGGAVLVVTLAPLLLAAWLQPNDSGLGTHMQLGLPVCGFLLNTNMPCATCGMTTAFTYAAHGQLFSAFVAQPAGTVLCLMAAVLAILSGWSLVSGMSLRPIGQAMARTTFLVPLFGLILGSWGYTLLTYPGP